VAAAILADPSINEHQKQALLQIYESFRGEGGHRAARAPEDATDGEAGSAEQSARP
jgi:hypothetical protein